MEKIYTFNAKKGIVNDRDYIFHNPGIISSLSEGVNIDIDHEGNWGLRTGRDRIYEGTPHSIDPYGSGLFVESSTLKILNSDDTVSNVKSLTTNNGMVYCPIPQYGTVFTNGTDIGFYKNGLAKTFLEMMLDVESLPDIPDQELQYKAVIPAGHALAYLSGVLYVAKGKDIYYSDPHTYFYMDIRNKKMRYKDYISMLASVDDGLYVSDSTDTFFLHGKRHQDFDTKKIADYKAISGMNITVERALYGDYREKEREQSRIVFWLSEKGVCVGGNSGNFTNLTIQKHRMEDIPHSGTTLFRVNNGIPQFIAVGKI